MSENPNPTRCGNCGTENPPGQEFCVNCHAALTLSADPGVLAETPEAADELRQIETPAAQETPGVVVTGGLGGPPMAMPTERINPEPDQQPRA